MELLRAPLTPEVVPNCPRGNFTFQAAEKHLRARAKPPPLRYCSSFFFLFSLAAFLSSQMKNWPFGRFPALGRKN